MAQEATLEKRETQHTQTEQLRGGARYVPAVDIVEQENELLLIADMPGVNADGVEIDYERGVLTVYGKVAPRQDEGKTNFLLREYGVGDFSRQFSIGEGIDAEGIDAELRDGVLTVHLPKAKEVLPRKITVKAN